MKTEDARLRKSKKDKHIVKEALDGEDLAALERLGRVRNRVSGNDSVDRGCG